MSDPADHSISPALRAFLEERVRQSDERMSKLAMKVQAESTAERVWEVRREMEHRIEGLRAGQEFGDWESFLQDLRMHLYPGKGRS